MPNLPHEAIAQTTNRGGGRIASDLYRQSLSYCQEFTGLEEDIDRYDLLLLTKRVGKLAGFTSRMIQLLEYYMAYTRACDWEEGSRPIVYQSLARTALDLGVSERQIQKLEKQLFEAGAITWNDSGNHKRFGKRNSQTGKIEFAYGVALTPLSYLKAELETKLIEKQLRDKAWLEAKREISSYRRQIRSLLLEAEEGGREREVACYVRDYQSIAIQIRTNLRLEQLRQLLSKHQRLHAHLMAHLPRTPQGEIKSKEVPPKATKGSCTSEPKFVHIKYRNQVKKISSSSNKRGFQEKIGAASLQNQPTKSSGLEHLTLKQTVVASCDRFQEHLSLKPSPLTWQDFVEAAFRLKDDLAISQMTWAKACQTMGRREAAIGVMLTSHATQRPHNRVQSPAAYYHRLVQKARVGELRLHNSVFGLLEKQQLKKSSDASCQAPSQ